MSSVPSNQQASSLLLPCPVRMLYGMTDQRRSRNMASMGMLILMAALIWMCLSLYTERTVTIPAATQQRVQQFILPEFRRTHVQVQKPEMQKLITDESEFQIPEEPEPIVEKLPEPEPEIVPPEPIPEPKPEPRPEPKPKPKPKQKPAQKPQPAKKVEPNVPMAAEAVEGEGSATGNAAVSIPAAVGTEQMEKNRQANVLAVILQAIEKYKRYPRQGRRSGAEGVCNLTVRIGDDGHVASCTVTRGSGKTVLDAACSQLGEKLIGLYVGSRGKLNVVVPVHYKLTDR